MIDIEKVHINQVIRIEGVEIGEHGKETPYNITGKVRRIERNCVSIDGYMWKVYPYQAFNVNSISK